MKENMGQYTLCLLAIWCIGEFGHLLTTSTEPVTEDQICSQLENAMSLAEDDMIKEYVLTAFLKLTIRLPSSLPRIRDTLT